jgi:transcriptional regulator with XRE-family HTH domain
MRWMDGGDMAARPGDMSRRITEGREGAGLGRREAARRLGVTARHLRAWERGRGGIPKDVRTGMASLYGLPLTDLVPARPDVASDGDGMITIGSVAFSVRGATDNSLREFLDGVRSQRKLAGDAEVAIRADEAVVLAGVLGGTPEAIVARIRQLLDVTDDEAEELGAWIWRRRAVAGAVAAGALAFSAGAVFDNASANPTAAPVAAAAAADAAPIAGILPIVQTSPAPAPAPAPVAAKAATATPQAPKVGARAEDTHDAHLAQITALEARLAEAQAKIAEQAAMLAAVTGQLADNDLMVADRGRQTGDQQSVISQQAAAIAGLNAELVNQGGIIAELNRQLAEQAAATAAAVRTAAEQAAVIESLQQELAATGGETLVAQAEAAKTIAAQAAIIDALKQETVTTKIQLEIAVHELEALAKELSELKKKTPPGQLDKDQREEEREERKEEHKNH